MTTTGNGALVAARRSSTSNPVTTGMLISNNMQHGYNTELTAASELIPAPPPRKSLGEELGEVVAACQEGGPAGRDRLRQQHSFTGWVPPEVLRSNSPLGPLAFCLRLP